MTPVVLVSTDGTEQATVNVEGIDPAQYQQVSDFLGVALQQQKTQAYIGVSKAMQLAIKLCPKANPADLWVHVIYHQFRNRYKKIDQSWKRVSGQALEHVIMAIYNPRLNRNGIQIRFSRGSDAKLLGLIERGVGSSKTDLILEARPKSDPIIFGVIHVKSSIAERLTDDAPASSALIKQGYWSSVVTMDCKMFPPPHGDGVVHGELGRTKAGDKRRYFEVAGQFSGCYSFNLRTPQSEGTTASGARIYALSFSKRQPDVLVTDIVKAWQKFQRTKRGGKP
jgi:hypothetical protein